MQMATVSHVAFPLSSFWCSDNTKSKNLTLKSYPFLTNSSSRSKVLKSVRAISDNGQQGNAGVEVSSEINQNIDESIINDVAEGLKEDESVLASKGESEGESSEGKTTEEEFPLIGYVTTRLKKEGLLKEEPVVDHPTPEAQPPVDYPKQKRQTLKGNRPTQPFLGDYFEDDFPLLDVVSTFQSVKCFSFSSFHDMSNFLVKFIKLFSRASFSSNLNTSLFKFENSSFVGTT